MNESNQTDETRELAFSTLARNLMLARKTAGLTQQALADAANVARATINQIENGEADPRLSTLSEIAAALGISPLLFFLGEKEMRALTETMKRALANEIPKGPCEDDVTDMKRLLKTGLQKNLVRAAAIGAEVAGSSKPKRDQKRPDSTALSKTVVDASAGAAIGAAIGSVLLPGLGTVLGLIIGGGAATIGKQQDVK